MKELVSTKRLTLAGVNNVIKHFFNLQDFQIIP